MDAISTKARTGDVRNDLHLVSDFFQSAEKLRMQFENRVFDSIEQNDGLTPFTYAFSPGNYHFLTASADRIFSRDLLEELINAVRVWGHESFGASSVSTPQMRIYTSGCERALVPDLTEAKHHWILSLSRGTGSRTAELELMTQSIAAETANEPLCIDRVVSLNLKFNQLLVHDARQPYGVYAPETSPNPLEAQVFVDGYAW